MIGHANKHCAEFQTWQVNNRVIKYGGSPHKLSKTPHCYHLSFLRCYQKAFPKQDKGTAVSYYPEWPAFENLIESDKWGMQFESTSEKVSFIATTCLTRCSLVNFLTSFPQFPVWGATVPSCSSLFFWSSLRWWQLDSGPCAASASSHMRPHHSFDSENGAAMIQCQKSKFQHFACEYCINTEA